VAVVTDATVARILFLVLLAVFTAVVVLGARP
jgi:hypothetical protein